MTTSTEVSTKMSEPPSFQNSNRENSKFSSQRMSPDEVSTDSDRDFFMSSEEARDYGLIDEIVESSK